LGYSGANSKYQLDNFLKLINLIRDSNTSNLIFINKINQSMVDIASFKNMALSFPETVELPHFEKASFRVKNKIFATLDTVNQKACLKFSEIDQSVFCAIDAEMIYPVDNKWGKQGWTFVELKKVKKSLLKDALSKAHMEVASAKIKSKK